MRGKQWLTIFLLLLCSFPLFGQSPSELTDNQAVLTQYMHTFQMDNWHIQLVMVDRKMLTALLGTDQVVGGNSLNPNTHYGIIWVLKRNEYGPKFFESVGMNPQDDEWVIVDQRNTVVHELIHMVWRHCTVEELCVAMLAEAVVPHEDTK